MGAHPYSLKLKMSHLRSTEWERSSLGCIWRGRWTAFNHNLIIRCWGWCVSRSVFVWCVWCGVTKCLACNHWTVSHFFLSWTPHYTYNALQTCDVIKITEHTYFSQFDVTYDQVWWPILGICALRLTHPKCTHTAVNTDTTWTHTWSSGQPFMLWRLGSSWQFGVLLKGTSSWNRGIEGGESAVHSLPPPTIPASLLSNP